MLLLPSFPRPPICCTLPDPSIPHQLQKPAVLLTDFAGFLERPGALPVKAAEVTLNIRDVILKILADDIGVIQYCLRIARHEGTGRREAGFSETRSRDAGQKGQSL